MNDYDDLTEDIAKIVGVSDDHDTVAAASSAAHQQFGDPAVVQLNGGAFALQLSSPWRRRLLISPRSGSVAGKFSMDSSTSMPRQRSQAAFSNGTGSGRLARTVACADRPRARFAVSVRPIVHDR
ncbi:hypothetical protein ACPPVO_21930 [Dactylosporangium sp. McL0621]|uniref:hypothetical protein n=1 Tax=Dactylosporangium sp. McL0621 TaxID=3415678 RepID=UPI003CEAB0F4